MWALLRMCVDSAGEPPTFLDSVPKTDSSPQPPARAFLAATPYTPTSARPQISELGLVRESPYTQYCASPHTPTHLPTTTRWTVRVTLTRESGKQRFLVYQSTLRCVTIRTVSPYFPVLM